jgi:hypothetical protein
MDKFLILDEEHNLFKKNIDKNLEKRYKRFSEWDSSKEFLTGKAKFLPATDSYVFDIGELKTQNN